MRASTFGRFRLYRLMTYLRTKLILLTSGGLFVILNQPLSIYYLIITNFILMMLFSTNFIMMIFV